MPEIMVYLVIDKISRHLQFSFLFQKKKILLLECILVQIYLVHTSIVVT